MSTPFDKASSSIPVTVVTTPGAQNHAGAGARLLHLEPALHEHERGGECVACAARGDIRAMLFDLLQQSRAEQRPLTSVVVDASSLADPQPVIDRLQTGTVPAFLGLMADTSSPDGLITALPT